MIRTLPWILLTYVWSFLRIYTETFERDVSSSPRPGQLSPWNAASGVAPGGVCCRIIGNGCARPRWLKDGLRSCTAKPSATMPKLRRNRAGRVEYRRYPT
jgi:hypothetical protein